MAGHAPAPGRLAAKTRYRQADAPCSFHAHAADAFQLDFSPPDPAQWAVTPGQSAVLYDGEVCLGGGVISQAWPDARAQTPVPDAPATPAATH